MKKYIIEKIISIFIILSVISCTSVKTKTKHDSQLIQIIFEDYIKEHKEYKPDRELKAVEIYVRKEKSDGLTVSIFDIPIDNITIKSEQEKLIGQYNNILFEIYGLDNLEDKKKSFFQNPNFHIDTTTMLIKKLSDEWEPYVYIQYDFKKNYKTIRYLDGRKIEQKFKF
ncbi:hypothetical protein [Flavobacterium sp. '19STA2R22 D10 B1']|uniref:hypothetical protein n=1 Tax=Flavobacterium aerium TaxID=3037261 RepID=UPI00278C5348|nr:hypothetical protein [Flavobacterium sp. '19STA2R22 D10 B1']